MAQPQSSINHSSDNIVHASAVIGHRPRTHSCRNSIKSESHINKSVEQRPHSLLGAVSFNYPKPLSSTMDSEDHNPKSLSSIYWSVELHH